MSHKILTVRAEERIKLLERENALLNSIIQGASDAIYAKDLNGRYITINEVGASYFGLSIEEVMGCTDIEVKGADEDTISNCSEPEIPLPTKHIGQLMVRHDSSGPENHPCSMTLGT